MTATLAAWVHMPDSDGTTVSFGPGSTPPDWAARQITNPKAWTDGQVPSFDEPETEPEPAEPKPEDESPVAPELELKAEAEPEPASPEPDEGKQDGNDPTPGPEPGPGPAKPAAKTWQRRTTK